MQQLIKFWLSYHCCICICQTCIWTGQFNNWLTRAGANLLCLYSFFFSCVSVVYQYMYFFQVRLICNDGTRYTKDVDIVRKCACTKKCYWLTHAAVHTSDTGATDLPWEMASPQAVISPPVKLTFFIPENASNDQPSDVFYYPDQYNSAKNDKNRNHDSYCIISAFLYFTTITSFTYLLVIWIKQKMHIQMEVLHWWWLPQ